MSVLLRPGSKPGAPAVLSRVRRRGSRFLMTACLLAAVLLAGCAGASDLDEGTAGKFQMRVATAKQLAADQNFPGALAELDQLSREVQQGAEQGAVPQQRRSRIDASISKVRADLEAANAVLEPDPIQTAPAPEPSVGGDEGDEKSKEEEESGGKGEDKGKGKGD